MKHQKPTLAFTCLALALSMVIAPPLPAASLMAPPQLSESEFADTETATNLVFDAGTARDNKWRLSIELDATPSNCVEVAFGTDADGNGGLGADEGELSVAWDGGEWILRDRIGGEVRCVASSSGRNRLDLALYLNESRHGRRFGPGTFQGEAAATFFNPAWNMARVVRRGAIPANEHIESLVTRDALAILVR